MTDSSDPDADGGSSRPDCPECGRPVATVTVVGPTEGVVGPCGCRVAPGAVTDSRLE